MGSNFAEQFQGLLNCLQDQKEVYSRLLEVLGSEKSYLILVDVSSLVENNKLKESLLAKSRALERIRVLRVGEVLKSLNSPHTDLPVSDLIKVLPTEAAKKLIDIQADLNKILQILREANLQNEKFAANARNAIESGLKAMRGESPGSQTYKKQGKLGPGRSLGKIVSKEI